MLEGLTLIVLIALAAIGSITLVFASIYYYNEVVKPLKNEKEKAKAEAQRTQAEYEEADRVINEALRADY
jgi:uncharacterized protein YpmB